MINYYIKRVISYNYLKWDIMVEEVKTSFYIRKDILHAVKRKALDEETSLKEILTRYIIEGLKRDEEDHEQKKLDVK